MRAVTTIPLAPRLRRSSGDRPQKAPRPRRRPVRPLDDGTTEVIHLIGFALPAGDSIQPVIFLDRQLLD